jgi:hypothetical protein
MHQDDPNHTVGSTRLACAPTMVSWSCPTHLVRTFSSVPPHAPPNNLSNFFTSFAPQLFNGSRKRGDWITPLSASLSSSLLMLGAIPSSSLLMLLWLYHSQSSCVVVRSKNVKSNDALVLASLQQIQTGAQSPKAVPSFSPLLGGMIHMLSVLRSPRRTLLLSLSLMSLMSSHKGCRCQ